MLNIYLTFVKDIFIECLIYVFLKIIKIALLNCLGIAAQLYSLVSVFSNRVCHFSFAETFCCNISDYWVLLSKDLLVADILFPPPQISSWNFK